MMRLSAVAALVVVSTAVATTARAERLTVAVSTPTVEISSNFTGTNITVFGVIEPDAPTMPLKADYQVAVLVLGPPESVVVRRKDSVLGIWVNRASETIVGAPAFYAINTSGAIGELADPATLARLGLGFDNIGLTYRGRLQLNDPAASEFRAAYIRLKEKASLFDEQTAVEFLGDTVFRTTTRLPANTPVGRYSVLVYLFADEALIAHSEEAIAVSKTGLEQLIPTFALSQSLIYGILCVAIAIFVGWLGGVIFRRD